MERPTLGSVPLPLLHLPQNCPLDPVFMLESSFKHDRVLVGAGLQNDNIQRRNIHFNA